ncbi:MAG TPA: hypothetical protein VN886_11825 [Acidimicrobiales bacterium]|nr:hypothetical protein [Acidimicrobiales bacterium]
MASVLSALSATTDSGSFNITYQFSGASSPTSPATTTTSQCVNEVEPVSGEATTGPGDATHEVCGVVEGPNALGGEPITGQGTIDTDPYGMVATSQVPGLGTVTLRTDANDIWEMGGADYGLSPGSSSGPGSSLSGFASLVEGTLGQREGASAMLGLASPTGYLNLDQQEITGADFIGTGTVDGVAVDQYRVFIDPSEEADLPNLTTEQSTTISQALAVLAQNGYLGVSTVVSIDGSGYIRQTASTAKYSDSSTSMGETTLSDFGCAGTVLMPGQQGSATPPAGCVSPDTGAPLVATTTTTSAPGTTTTTSSASTVPPPTTPTTISNGPVSTTSTTTFPTTSTTATTPPHSTTSTTTRPTTTTTMTGPSG